MHAPIMIAIITLSLGVPSGGLSAQDTPRPTANSCQPADSPHMQSLLIWTRRTISSDVGSAPMWREKLFEGKMMSPAAVQPVLEEAVCAKVVRLLKADVGFADSTANDAAVVRVDGKYIAKFWFRTPGLGASTGTFYFDRGFTRVVTRSR